MIKEKVKKTFYKKWWVWLIAIIIVIAIASCGGGEEKNTKTAKPTKTEQPNQSKQVDQAAFKAYASNIKGAAFVKTISVTDNKGYIEYFGSYDEFIKAKPESLLKKEDYNSYFDTGDAIEKILVGENVRLLRQFPDLTSTSMVLPYGGKTYSIDLDHIAVTDYLGFKVEDLKVDDGSWNKKFSDPYIYNDANRKQFFDKFVQVK